MRNLRLFAALLGLSFCLQGAAFAEGPQLLGVLAKGEGVTQVMQRARCVRGWLSQVVADSGLDPAKLRHLPIGQKIVLGAGSCEDDPPARVADLSQMLLRVDLSLNEAQELLVKVAALRSAATAANLQLENLTAENAKLSLQVLNLERELKQAGEKLAETKPGFSLQAIGSAALFGFSFGAALTYFAIVLLGIGKVSFPRRWTIRDHGRTYDFVLVGAGETAPGTGDLVGIYRCPLCSERNLHGRDGNLRRHMQKHSEKRVEVEIDPLLQAAADDLRAAV